jgi:hypothetical protein
VEGAATKHPSDVLKLAIFLGILAFVGNLARLGRLPRTRPSFQASSRFRD